MNLRKICFLLTLFPLSLLALEIHCQSDLLGLEIIVIRSPQTQFLYLVPIKDDQATPIKLAEKAARIGENTFDYQDEQLMINIDGNSGDGKVVVVDESPLILNSCEFL